MHNNVSFFKRLLYQYRLSVMNEETWEESWHAKISILSALVWLTLSFFLTLGVFCVLILYTPIKNVLPGYSESIRHQLIEQTAVVDSLGTSLEVQRRYLLVIRDVVAGQVQSDTVQTLDSMQIVMGEQLLQAKNEATADFIAQYEQKEKDNLLLFDVQSVTPAVTFFRPANGSVVTHYSEQDQQYSVEILTADNASVMSVLAGTVVNANYNINNTYTVVIQHGAYLSVYRNMEKALKQTGQTVQAGECIGICQKNQPLDFQLWENGTCLNPELVIAL